MKICFLDNTKKPYTSHDIYTNKIRGAENVVLNLSRELSKLNHKITIYNNCEKNIKIDNIDWININNINDNPYYDLAISNNDIRLFDKIKATKKVAISHSIQSIEKFIRKHQLLAYIKHKPKIALLGESCITIGPTDPTSKFLNNDRIVLDLKLVHIFGICTPIIRLILLM